MLPDPIEKRIERDPNSGCWLWSGWTIKGYPALKVDGSNRIIARLVWEAEVGSIPSGHAVTNACGQPRCLCPRHLVCTARGETPAYLEMADAETGKWPSLQERLAEKSELDPATGCVIWRGYRNAFGYGWLSHRGRDVPAHRAAYELVYGEVSSDLVMDHLCCNKSCINPDHLEPVTNLENLRRGHVRKGRWPA